MSKRLYTNYLKLFLNWPVDQTKKGRDLGEFIRDKFLKAFPKGEVSKISNIPECTAVFESLQRLASNYHSKKYPRLYNSTSTGVTAEKCTLFVSDAALKELKDLKI